MYLYETINKYNTIKQSKNIYYDICNCYSPSITVVETKQRAMK